MSSWLNIRYIFSDNCLCEKTIGLASAKFLLKGMSQLLNKGNDLTGNQSIYIKGMSQLLNKGNDLTGNQSIYISRKGAGYCYILSIKVAELSVTLVGCYIDGIILYFK